MACSASKMIIALLALTLAAAGPLASATQPQRTSKGALGRRLLHGDWGVCDQVQTRGCDILDNSPHLEDHITPVQMVGGHGGTSGMVQFCDQESMNFIKKMLIYWDREAHQDMHFVDQVTLFWDDGRVDRLGSCRGSGGQRIDCASVYSDGDSGHVYPVDMGVDNPVTALSMAVDGQGARNVGGAGQMLGTLQVETLSRSSGGRALQGYSAVGTSGTLYRLTNVGSGVACGVTFRHGDGVNAFGLLFFDKLYSASVVEQKFQFKPEPQVSSQSSSVMSCPGAGAQVGSVQVTRGESAESSVELSSSSATELGLTVGITLGVPLVAEVNTEFSLKTTKTTTTTRSTKTGQTTSITTTMNDICPGTLSTPEGRELKSGDCCQFYSAQLIVSADRVPWTGTMVYSFHSPSRGAVNVTRPVSGVSAFKTYGTKMVHDAYCQPRPANGRGCASLPAYQVTVADIVSGGAVSGRPAARVAV